MKIYQPGQLALNGSASAVGLYNFHTALFNIDLGDHARLYAVYEDANGRIAAN